MNPLDSKSDTFGQDEPPFISKNKENFSILYSELSSKESESTNFFKYERLEDSSFLGSEEVRLILLF